MKSNKRGITLIALIITVIILLILAGTAISIATNGNNIFEKAKTAVDIYNDKALQEDTDIEMYNDYFEIYSTANDNAPEGSVARIENEYYTTLQSAIDAVPTNNAQTRVILLKNISESVTVTENKNIVLLLNGNTITNEEDTPIITLYGKLAIKNGSLIGQFGAKVPTILVNENSEIRLSNTIVNRNSEVDYKWETVELYGALYIDSGKIFSSNCNAICTYDGYDSYINISGTAEIDCDGYTTISSRGTIIMTGGKISHHGTIKSTTLRNCGTAKITGGVIESFISNAIVNEAEATIEIGGTAEIVSDDRGITFGNYGTAKITGGKISSPQYWAIDNLEGGTMEISGTAVIEGEYIALLNDSAATIKGGHLISRIGTTISNRTSTSTIYLLRGTAECKQEGGNCLYNHGTAYKTDSFQTIGSIDGTVTPYTETE